MQWLDTDTQSPVTVLVSLSPRPTSRSIASPARGSAGDAIHPVLREVGLGDSETIIVLAKETYTYPDISHVNTFVML